MIEHLPSIFDKVKDRPGTDAGKDRHRVPDDDYNEFWEAFYALLFSRFKFQTPIANIEEHINPYFGYFGMRYHPTKFEPSYYHLGIDISGKAKTPIYPIHRSVLEYSGYATVNGNYVFLSHPDIVTEDGFKLYSLYMHLKTCAVKFTSYQKMLRQISFNHYPTIPISRETILGGMGSSGNSDGTHVHLHLQIEFRDEKGNIIVLDPARVLGLKNNTNLSAPIHNTEEFEQFKKENEGDLKKYFSFKK